MHHLTVTATLIAAGIASAAAAQQTGTPAPTPPAPPAATSAPAAATSAPAAAPAADATATADQAATPAAEAAPAPANPFDQLLVAAKPMTADPHTAPAKLSTASTNGCITSIAVAGGGKYSIDLAKQQAMAVNTNLMITGGGHSVQMEFDGKDGSKQAADAEKAMTALTDKCS